MRTCPTATGHRKRFVDYTRGCVEDLFARGAKLALLGCNTATSVALRRLQQQWLPKSRWAGTHNVLGIVAPDRRGRDANALGGGVAAIPAEKQYRHHRRLRNDTHDSVGRLSGEIRKRCPKVTVVQQVCSELAGAIEDKRPESRTRHSRARRG